MNLINLKNREDCLKADKANQLSIYRDQFLIPEGKIYFMGNSLGLCPKGVKDAVLRTIVDEWGQNVIEGFSKNNWFNYPTIIGNKVGKLIGAEDGETILLESTSTSIFKTLAASIEIQKIDNPNRRVIVLEQNNFPTDNYIAEGLLNLIRTDGYKIRYFNDENSLKEAIKDDTVLVLLSAVNYRTSYLYDIAKVTSMAHLKKAHIIWDLSHATGAIPIDLNKINADFSIGCTYKYLNCGPGAPSFLWVNKKHHDRIYQPISGWYSHSHPFQMDHKYEPAKGIQQFSTGSPNVIAMAAINFGITLFEKIDMNLIREKSLQLGDFFIQLIEEKCPSLVLVTPKVHEKRGSHLSFKHENGFNISKLLKELKVICDYRHPLLIRFAMTPLYLRFVDIFDAVEIIRYAVENSDNEIVDSINQVT